MSTAEHTTGNDGCVVVAGVAAADAKARLLAWADASDARARKTRLSVGKIVAGGVFAVLGGMTVARVLRPRERGEAAGSPVKARGRHWLRWAVVARVGAWAIPHAVGAVRSHMKGRAAD